MSKIPKFNNRKCITYNILKFLDDQAKKEKEYKIAVEYINKRNYLDFMNKTKKFLEDNFNYFASKYYIYYIINTIFE